MKGYTNDYDKMVEHMARYTGPHQVEIMRIDRLRVSMPGNSKRLLIQRLGETLHYQYTLGNTQPYKDWLVANNHFYELSLASFEHLMNDDSNYLDEPHDQDFILYYQGMDYPVIIDGVHRATRLFQLGVEYAPVLRKIT